MRRRRSLCACLPTNKVHPPPPPHTTSSHTQYGGARRPPQGGRQQYYGHGRQQQQQQGGGRPQQGREGGPYTFRTRDGRTYIYEQYGSGGTPFGAGNGFGGDVGGGTMQQLGVMAVLFFLLWSLWNTLLSTLDDADNGVAEDLLKRQARRRQRREARARGEAVDDSTDDEAGTDSEDEHVAAAAAAEQTWRPPVEVTAAVLRRRGWRNVTLVLSRGWSSRNERCRSIWVSFKQAARVFANDRLDFTYASGNEWKEFAGAEFGLDEQHLPAIVVLGSGASKGAVYASGGTEDTQAVQAWLERLLDGQVPMRLLESDCPLVPRRAQVFADEDEDGADDGGGSGQESDDDILGRGGDGEGGGDGEKSRASTLSDDDEAAESIVLDAAPDMDAVR